MKKFVLVLTAVLGIVMMGCDSGSTGGSGVLSYVASLDCTDYQGGQMTSYLLNISYQEARSILIQQLGSPAGEAGLQGNGDFAGLISIGKSGNWVILQDCYGLGQYRLIGSSNLAGTLWNKSSGDSIELVDKSASFNPPEPSYSIIGRWVGYWYQNGVETNEIAWELRFIDSSNLIIDTPAYGWTGTGTYEVSEQRNECISVLSGYGEHGILSFNTTYQIDGVTKTFSEICEYHLSDKTLWIHYISGNGGIADGTYYKK